MKTTLNVHPADGIRAYEDCYPEVAEAMGVDAKKEEPVNFDIADPKFVDVYFDKVHHPMEKEASISGGLTGSRDKVPRSRVLIRCGC